ncbi:tetratricopeptide repeat protein [Actinoplanes subglobosus]|uniref:Tetratricopeptide repeat protein n=1 Tax=Actinoplanes subglobosus TaxID=1547892 RepID=A0ABV8IR44_9ACTN
MAEAAPLIIDLLSRYERDLNSPDEALAEDSPLTPADRGQLVQLLEQARRPPHPPLTAASEMADLVRQLATTSLITTLDDGRMVMHRWTATELHRHWTSPHGRHHRPGLVTAAHHAAAAFWQWRFETWPQSAIDDLHDLEEARHHRLAIDDLETAGTITEHICSQLDQWGAWDRETSLIHDTLRWLPEDSSRRPAWYQQLGIIAHNRGDYTEAERRYQQALTIFEELGNQAGTANSYHQLGIVAQNRGDYTEAERRYQQALTIFEELGDQTGTAGSYHQLGIIAHNRGDYTEAERRYQQALTIEEELGNQAGMANSYGQLGNFAEDRGDYTEAERRYQQALTIFEELGIQTGMASSYHQLGIIAQKRGDYTEAERRYQQALTIDEELGNQAGTASSYHQLGIIAQTRGDYTEAERRYQQALTIEEELGNRAGMAISISQIGTLRTETNNLAEAVTFHCRALAISLGIGVPQAGFNIARLRDLRAKLDGVIFSDAATAVLDEELFQDLNALLDQAEGPEQEDNT